MVKRWLKISWIENTCDKDLSQLIITFTTNLEGLSFLLQLALFTLDTKEFRLASKANR